MSEEIPARLDTLGCGALLELFDIELARVLENIADPNTDADAARAITLKVVFVPDKTRQAMQTRMSVVSKLAPVARVESTLFLGRLGGRLVAVEHDPRQLTFPDFSEPAPVAPGPDNVVNFPTGTKAGA